MTSRIRNAIRSVAGSVATFFAILWLSLKNGTRRLVTGDWRIQTQIESVRVFPYAMWYGIKNGVLNLMNVLHFWDRS